MSDPDLLQAYARDHSQAAFAALVKRYVDLVYSAALRQVRATHLAEEVAQSVFLDLARTAGRIRPAQPLAAWLFLVTRRTAVDVLRREARRRAREQTAAEIAAMKTPAPSWSQIKDVLDEALESLSETERSALLLRFFENRSLREVGESLGISEDTAQKRVSRALDRLRDKLVRRGVAVTAAGLATELSAHAVQAAPSALGASIAAGATVPAALAAAASGAGPAGAWLGTKGCAALVTIAVAAGVYEASALFRGAADLEQLRGRSSEIGAALARTRANAEAAAAAARAAKEETARLAVTQVPLDPEIQAAGARWIERRERLQQLAAERADLRIAELEVLTDQAWFAAAKSARLDTEENVRAAFKELHQTARTTFARHLSRALRAYSQAHDGQLPRTARDLGGFLEPKIDAEILGRFELLHRGAFAAVPADEWILAERAEFAQRHDTRIFVTTREHGAEDLNEISERELRRAVRAFAAANAGALPPGPEPLLAYLKYAPRPQALEAFVARPRADFAPEALRKLLNSD